jgi:RHS repeat-associated protein
MTYDAENRITSATQSGIGSMYYLYDGAGRRVQEVSTYNIEKVFVYDVFGQMAAEYSLGAPSLPCTTCYIATDHLGSTRLVTDQNANVVGRHDYLPFGEEIAANTGGRNSLFGTQDFVNQKFTGQERDSETGLDFFQTRYFSGALGRFASPDTPLLDQNPSNPQSWNLYTYVRNNPLNLIDPDGHTCVTATGEPVAPDYPDVKVDNNDGYGCQTVVTVYGGYIDPISVILSLSRLVLLPAQTSSQQEIRPLRKDEVPDNVCEYAGRAPDPSFWASAGKDSEWDPISAVLDITKGFKAGGYLDAQPMASGDVYQRAAYGNYVFGVWMRASGTPLPIALASAAGIAAAHKVSNPGQYARRTMDRMFRSLPAANVMNITRGYNDQKNGTLCHK